MAYLTSLTDLDPKLETVASDSIYISRALMEHDHFKELKAKGKLLYSLLLNRLREPMDFIHKGYDERGNIFVCYTNKDLCTVLNISKTTLIGLKKKLHKYNLIEETQVGKGEPNRIYLTDELVKYLKETGV